MNDFFFLLLLAVPLTLAASFLIAAKRQRKELKPKDRSKLINELLRLENRSPSERIVGYDKVLDHALAAYGLHGTLGEKLKKEPVVLRGKLDEIWKFHKIRNRIVHDLEPVAGLDEHADRYKRLILEILT